MFVANFGGNNFLYRNDGAGNFVKITNGPVVNDDGRSTGSSWGDFDNDGDLDLFVANDSGNNFMYCNDQDAGFVKIAGVQLVNDGGASQGSSWGDFDNDGDLDLFVANNSEDNFLYLNHGNSNNWVNIKLIGTVSNTSAIGAKVKVKATIQDSAQGVMWQMREVAGQTGYLSQNSLNAEFGLGDATIIDSIRVEWPSGFIQDTTDIKANQYLTIKERAPFGFIQAQFTADKTEGAPPLTIHFMDQSVANPPVN